MSSPIVKVKPREGARIRQPNRNMRVMPPEGDFVSTDDTFYSSRILSGDLVVVEDKPAEKPQKETATKPDKSGK